MSLELIAADKLLEIAYEKAMKLYQAIKLYEKVEECNETIKNL